MTASYLTTHRINGRYAYRAWDGQWYLVEANGGTTGEWAATREAAVALLRSLPRSTNR